MMRFVRKLLILSAPIGGVLLFTAGVRADVPRLIPYQGLLTDSGGAPLPGPVNLLIRLYTAGTGGTQLFSETQNPVTLVDGVFSINIGSATTGGVPDTALNATQVWLGVSVDGGAEVTPRTRLGMVPYAAKGAAAERLVNPNTFITAASADASGNVGIGTSLPGAKLHVSGGGSFQGPLSTETLVSHGTDETGFSHSAGAYVRFTATRDFFIAPDISASAQLGVANLESGARDFFINTIDTGMSLSLRNQSSEKLAIVAEGSRFRANGSTNLLMTGASDDAFIDFVKNTGTTSSARIEFNGFSSQTTHEASMHFYTRQAADAGLRHRMQLTANGFLEMTDPAGVETFELRPDFGGGTGAWMTLRNSAGIEAVSFATENGSTGVGGLVDVKNDAGLTTIRLIGDTGGGFGQVSTSVLQITGGSDLAEPFDVCGESVEPGTVVVIDPEHPAQLRPSQSAYDRKVAGIISGAGGILPGMLMGQSGSIADGAHHVALTGRVYCKCDASNSPIEPGDLLTTSPTPGHAMKVSDHARGQGAVLGKAMTGLNQGKGLVLVLVTLQ